MQIYLVGGAVRDQLLGLPVKERDWVVVGATPQQMLDKGYRQVGKDFPVFLHPKTQDEYALARTERKTGPGYKGFSCYAAPDVTLEDDLLRRDLTINAMAQDKQGNIIDPYGGRQDIEKRLLRHVSPAFAEDPVRILRIARFAARYAPSGFTVAEETLQLMQKMVRAGEVNALVIERVWQELQKVLTEKQPQRFFEELRACGALKILFPEIDNLFGVPAPPQWHPEVDTGIHTLLVLKRAAQLSQEGMVRFAALVHDLGKGLTAPHLWPKHHGHDEMGVAPIKNLCRRYRAPKDYQELAVLVSRYHTLCHKVFEIKPSTVLKLLEQLDAYRRPQRFQGFLLACQADAQGRTGFEQKPYPQANYLLTLYRQTATITAEKFIAQGLQGLAIKQALYRERLRAIKRLLKDRIALVPYDTHWPQLAQAEIALLKQALPYDWLIDIQHVGSTAIAGLAAKPIIDLYVGVSSVQKALQAVKSLEALGYQFWQDNPNPEKLFFVKNMPPFGRKRTHHIHIVNYNSDYWRARLLFRDYLQTHAEEAKRYEQLKQRAMLEYFFDREQYTNSKYEFVAEILKKAGFKDEVRR